MVRKLQKYVKNLLFIFVIGIALLELPISTVVVYGAGGGDIQVFINNEPMSFRGAYPATTADGYTMLPLTQVAERLGCTVTWDNTTKQTTVAIGNLTLLVTTESRQVKYNKAINITLNAPVRNFSGYTYVPVDFFNLLGTVRTSGIGGSLATDNKKQVFITGIGSQGQAQDEAEEQAQGEAEEQAPAQPNDLDLEGGQDNGQFDTEYSYGEEKQNNGQFDTEYSYGEEKQKIAQSSEEDEERVRNAVLSQIWREDSGYLATEFITALLAGDPDRIVNGMFSSEMKNSLDGQALMDAWDSVSGSLGNYTYTGEIVFDEESKTNVELTAKVFFDNAGVKISMSVNRVIEINGLYFSTIPCEKYDNSDIPFGVVEEEVVFGADTDFPVYGTLTLPKQIAKDKKLRAVVLVHGSGPSNRNEAYYGMNPFRDLAWGLADKGIAVLRYDKRTYAYGELMTPEQRLMLTVNEETIDDAVLASEFLKNDNRIDSDNVFIIGHSLGGMLAPVIDTEGGDFKGLVIMAGSPRQLGQIAGDQFMRQLDSMEFENAMVKNDYYKQYKDEMKKLGTLNKMPTAISFYETVFGISAYYLREFESYNLKKTLQNLNKPMYILQGDSDFQVFADTDFRLYKSYLENKKLIKYKLYSNLNHFFMESPIEPEIRGTVEEYKLKQSIPKTVIQDIAVWIKLTK